MALRIQTFWRFQIFQIQINAWKSGKGELFLQFSEIVLVSWSAPDVNDPLIYCGSKCIKIMSEIF